MKCYDVNGDGSLSYEEFIRGLREPLNARRLQLVKKTFASLDKESSGKITVTEIANAINITADKDFQKGTKSGQQVVEEFLANFESSSAGLISE